MVASIAQGNGRVLLYHMVESESRYGVASVIWIWLVLYLRRKSDRKQKKRLTHIKRSSIFKSDIAAWEAV